MKNIFPRENLDEQFLIQHFGLNILNGIKIFYREPASKYSWLKNVRRRKVKNACFFPFFPILLFIMNEK